MSPKVEEAAVKTHDEVKKILGLNETQWAAVGAVAGLLAATARLFSRKAHTC